MSSISQRGHKSLIIGAPGSGKTWATATASQVPSKRVVYLMLENSLGVLVKALKAMHGGKVPDNVHWHDFSFQGIGLDELEASANAINTLEGDNLKKWRSPMKRSNTGFSDLVKVLKDFTDHRTGESLGSAAQWDNSTIFVVDSMTALTDMIWNQTFGGRVSVDWTEYSAPQGLLMNFVTLFCWQAKCNFVMTAHVEDRETQQGSGQFKQYPLTIGGKLRDKLAGYFDDVILAQRIGPNYVWNTATASADVKPRILPAATNLKPDFVQIYEAIAKLGETS